ncbi:MAG: glycoside hydrolase [Adhaeribacter sp.]|jgi:hypothetical protein|nr:glycoside hydrolase [Adhaeribacter sp.]
MRFLLFQLVLLFCLDSVAAQPAGTTDFQRQFKLLPLPQQVTLFSGQGMPSTSLRPINLKNTTDRPILYGLLENLPLTANPGKGVITLSIDNTKDLPVSPEGYIF